MFVQVAVNTPLFSLFEYRYESQNLFASMNLNPLNSSNGNEEQNSSFENCSANIIGCRVLVPFGNQCLMGVVVSTSLQSSISEKKVKDVIEVYDQTPFFSKDLIEILTWAANYYHYPIGEVFFTAIPTSLRKGEKAELKSIDGYKYCANEEIENSLKRSPVCCEVLQLLKDREYSLSALKDLGYSYTILKKLEDKKAIQKVNVRSKNKWFQSVEQIQINQELQLNDEQLKAYKQIVSQNAFGVFLINGVTGSGKTEIYLQVIRNCLLQHKQALVLIPEINLTPQTISRFFNRFPNVPIVSVHSSLNNTEKLTSFLTIKNEQSAILIGTRSAIFANFANLGVIIIDEEHDSSYKQNDGFLYHCRDLAVVRAKKLNIPVVLGTATPSFESLYNVRQQKYQQLLLTNRAANSVFPDYKIIDMRKSFVNHGISNDLIEYIKETLSNGEQVLLLLNKRGYAPKLICHDCGYVCQCVQCSTNLFIHKHENTMKCHHCDSIYPIPIFCPKCGSNNLNPTGLGTEQLYDYLKEVFPKNAIVRIDRDTTTRKDSLEKYINGILSNKYQIIIGTQILAKGHHFPNVTLVGIVDIDSFFASNDFRALEYCGQLITQVAGRSGRGTKQGKVVLQTYQPENLFLNDLLSLGYNFVAQVELQQRIKMCLPPYTAMAAIKADGTIKQNVTNLLDEIYTYVLNEISPIFPNLVFTKPLKPFIEKRINRYHLYMLFNAPNRAIIAKVLDKVIEHKFSKSGIHLVYEIDPADCFF